ncbi:MAG: hypothetical protein FWC78_04810 [Defluviitaleaceae bacterium]|nr:hypothetical protein [Defluviitaleaceae bacterium]
MNFDKDERRIQDAFSQVEVDDTYLAAKVKARMKASEATTPRLKWKLAAATFVLLALTMGTVYAATGLGVFDRFISGRDLDFAEIVQPMLVYAEDQGIRIEVIAAGQFGYDAVIYLAMRDVSGQNRLTPGSWKTGMGGPGSTLVSGLGLDEETNTVYKEMIISRRQQGVILLDYNHVILSDGVFLVEPFPIQPGEIPEAELVYYLTHGDIKILMPQPAGAFPPLPDGLYGSPQWISNVGIVDGHLHVQFAGRVGRGTATARLIAPCGEYVSSGVVTSELRPGADFGNFGAYSFTETIFPIDMANAEDYKLMLRVYYRESLRGRWVLEVDAASAQSEIFTWEGEVKSGEFTINKLTVSPLFVRFSGAFSGEFDSHDFAYHRPNVVLETAGGEIPLVGFAASFGAPRFELTYRTRTHLDVDAITAVVVDGVRIPVG